jgi:16S rRNA (cytosine967-C5)-methyltransferase
MTPAARVQAAIEVLDAVIAAARAQGAPADRIMADWARANRYAGSKDRRAVRELVYAAIRACGPVPPSGRAAMLRLAQTDEAIAPLFDGSKYGPAAVAEGEPIAQGGIAPGWLETALAASDIAGENAQALLDRAPLDIRINPLRQQVPLAIPGARRFPAGTQVEQWEAYKTGAIEVQDAGSQLACLAVNAREGHTVIDLCAGAGGKTLALAGAMKGEGTLIACDTDRGRLSRLAPRAARAGAHVDREILLNPGQEAEALREFVGKADRVLIDAPCSGTGTWRRNPEARWRLTQAALDKLTALQDRLLDLATGYVAPGGQITFVTCSLLDAEGRDRISAFLSRHEDWEAHAPQIDAGSERGHGIRLTPHADGTDGFFIANLSRRC